MYLTNKFTHRHLSVLALTIGMSFPMFAFADSETITRVDTVSVTPETYVQTTIPQVDPVTKVVSTTTKSTVDTNVVRRAQYPHRTSHPHHTSHPHRTYHRHHTYHPYRNVSNSSHVTRESTVTTGTTTLESRDGGPKSVILQPGVVYHGVGTTNPPPSEVIIVPASQPSKSTYTKRVETTTAY